MLDIKLEMAFKINQLVYVRQGKTMHPDDWQKSRVCGVVFDRDKLLYLLVDHDARVYFSSRSVQCEPVEQSELITEQQFIDNYQVYLNDFDRFSEEISQ